MSDTIGNENDPVRPGFSSGKRNQIIKYLKWTPLFLAFVALKSWAVMLLWNWLGPTVFHMTLITFWQALGIVVLAKILFGSHWGYWGRGWSNRRHYWKEKMEARLSKMTPEEREKFKEEWKQKCGHWKWGQSTNESSPDSTAQ